MIIFGISHASYNSEAENEFPGKKTLENNSLEAERLTCGTGPMKSLETDYRKEDAMTGCVKDRKYLCLQH